MKLRIKHILLSIIAGILFSTEGYAQESAYDSLLNYYLKSDSLLLDELESHLAEDTLDIMTLIDNLMHDDYRFSQLAVRLGYTSNITYAGRNFGIDQQGLSAGATYYHKSGLFADLSGYWNSDLKPKYNPTVASLGYMGYLNKKWSYTLSYDHFFYNLPDSSEIDNYYPITNALNSVLYYEIGKLTLSADYSFLFGIESAHRLRGNLMYTFSKKKWGFIDRFVFMPMASVLLGNAEIYQINPVYPEMNLRTRYDIRQLMVDEYGRVLINYLWHNNREKYLELEKYTYEQNKELFTEYEFTADKVFGVMNYSFSAPFYLYVRNFTLALSYNYNIPVELPGEELDVSPNHYFGAALIYNIPFKKRSPSLGF